MDKKIYVYCIYFPTSKRLKPYYIGQTAYLERRMNEHLCSGSLVCNALWKFNNWQVTILHTCKSRDEANRIEIEEIRNFDCIAPNGYNLTAGGEGGDTFFNNSNKDKTREKMRIAQIGNQNAKGHGAPKGNKNFFKHKQSKEAKEKNRQAHLGKKQAKKTVLKRERTKLIDRIAKLEAKNDNN